MPDSVFSNFQFIAVFALFSLLSPSSNAETADTDPYATIETIALKNGLKVFLAPSDEATLTEVRLEVDVGWDAEAKQDWGVSHLLEHVLFRDKQLKDEMSYLQLIREAGGEANGTTEARLTSYYGSIPAKKGDWLLKNFSKMIIAPSITDEYVEKEKGTVELERGKPGPITQLLGFNPRDYFYPSYLHTPDFWETEFHVRLDQPFTDSEEQLSTQRLTRSQVETHYKDFYYPANMRLFVAGKFNREKILTQIKTEWEIIPNRTGKTLPLPPTPKSNGHAYRRATITSESPYISIGSKFTDATQVSTLVAKSYVDYLAHRLMKEIRNLKGQTYTANGDFGYYKGSGFALIGFQTPKENLRENIKLVKHYFATEAHSGNITDQQIQEAKDLYLSQFHLIGREANDMMSFAERYWSILHEYGEFKSPYQVLKELPNEDYKAELQKVFNPKLSYESISEPPYFFHYDQFVFFMLTALFTFRALRGRLLKEFHNDRLRWTRKVQYPPLKFIELGLGVSAWFIYIHLIYPYNRLFQSVEWLGSTVLFSEYLNDCGNIVIAVLCAQGIISLVPRKLLVMDTNLIIKSISYYSKSIPFEQIAAIENLSFFKSVLNFSYLLRIKFRFFYFNPMFWKRGLYIQLKSGEAYFISVTSPHKACEELKRLMGAMPVEGQKANTEPSNVA